MDRITTEEVRAMSIRELKELVYNSSRFHRIKHTDSFIVLIDRLEQMEKDVQELAKKDRRLIAFLVSCIKCGEDLNADDNQWIDERLAELESLIPEGEKDGTSTDTKAD